MPGRYRRPTRNGKEDQTRRHVKQAKHQAHTGRYTSRWYDAHPSTPIFHSNPSAVGLSAGSARAVESRRQAGCGGCRGQNRNCRRSPAQPLSPPSIASRMPLRRAVARPGPGECPGGAGPSRPGVSNSDDSVQPRRRVSNSDDSDVLGSRPGSVVRGALGRPDPDRGTQMFRRERGRKPQNVSAALRLTHIHTPTRRRRAAAARVCAGSKAGAVPRRWRPTRPSK